MTLPAGNPHPAFNVPSVRVVLTNDDKKLAFLREKTSKVVITDRYFLTPTKADRSIVLQQTSPAENREHAISFFRLEEGEKPEIVKIIRDQDNAPDFKQQFYNEIKNNIVVLPHLRFLTYYLPIRNYYYSNHTFELAFLKECFSLGKKVMNLLDIHIHDKVTEKRISDYMVVDHVVNNLREAYGDDIIIESWESTESKLAWGLFNKAVEK